jgi:hypothetical protein
MRDESERFEALEKCGVRALVIGRRAMIALGVPVMTTDYELWVHIDDIETLNAALAPLDFAPNAEPSAARSRGRYVLENHDHIDVLVARRQTTKEGDVVEFDEVWSRRIEQPYAGATRVLVPCIDDLVRTKKWGMRAKDIADIQLLEALKRDGEPS